MAAIKAVIPLLLSHHSCLESPCSTTLLLAHLLIFDTFSPPFVCEEMETRRSYRTSNNAYPCRQVEENRQQMLLSRRLVSFGNHHKESREAEYRRKSIQSPE